MKKIIALLVSLAIVLSLTACGAENPNAGTYNAVSCKALGISLGCEGDWLELKGNGKGKVCLMGEEYNCSWTLEGENFTLKNHGDEFSGTLRNGIITLDYGDMIYVYIMDEMTMEDGTVIAVESFRIENEEGKLDYAKSRFHLTDADICVNEIDFNKKYE